ncbi:50S ribosomal protein L24 [candidate division Kazan bacterium]|uniref:Large ribosomal subunit protein uL24 n=1 Tax=candidate division Kazan bacterium TaxID=2202143 RepID=A0A420ZE57_UNCK3|nr:MAG: 50S ribosomal protein L24 [candidate division Kazan bacterium]
MRIKTGDKVLVIKGKDRGKSGKVVVADPKCLKVKVEGINIYKRHQRRGRTDRTPGGIVEIVAPMPVEKVMLICPNCNQPSRVRNKVVGEKKQRQCVKCKAIITHAKK